MISVAAEDDVKARVDALMSRVVSLDAAIRWVAVETAGRERYWGWRDPPTGELRVRIRAKDAALLDPHVIKLAFTISTPSRSSCL